MDGGVAAWERRRMGEGRIRLDGEWGRFGAVWAAGWVKGAGKGESGRNAIFGTCSPSAPHLLPIFSPSKQPNPTTRFWCARGKKQYDKGKRMYEVCTIERRVGKVCTVFIYILYIIYCMYMSVSCCCYRGGGVSAYRKSNTNGGWFALFLVVGSGGNGGV